jgi:hypothetical protein
MTREGEPLFREEAVAHRARQPGPGEVAPVNSVWIDRLYWVLLGLAVVGAVLAWLVEVDGRRLLHVLFGSG